MFAEDGRITENKVSAKEICVLSHPEGEFQFLLHKLTTIANSGRTSAKLPYARYILKNHADAKVQAKFYPLD